MAPFFAVVSAFLYGLSNVLTKVGMRHTNAKSAVVISLVGSFLFVSIYALGTTTLAGVPGSAALLFLAAGIVGPFVGRVLLFMGIDRVGAAVSSTLYEDKPLFSVLAAVLVLGERLTASVAMGVGLMMAGIFVVGSGESQWRIDGRTHRKRDLLLPLGAGACYGLSHVIRKVGLNVLPDPVVGVIFQNVGAVVLIPVWAFSRRIHSGPLARRMGPWLFFLPIGLMHVVAQWCLFKALELGDVVVVSPLSSLSTFFVLVLSAIFLKKLEKVTWQIVVGACLLAGATLLLTRGA